MYMFQIYFSRLKFSSIKASSIWVIIYSFISYINYKKFILKQLRTKLISQLTQTRFTIVSQLITRMAFTMEGTRIVVTNLSATSCTFGTFVYICGKSTKKLVNKTINIYNDTSNCRNIFASLSEIYIFIKNALFCYSFKTCLQFIFYLKYRTFEIFHFLRLFFFFFSKLLKNKRMINPLNFGILIGNCKNNIITLRPILNTRAYK